MAWFVMFAIKNFYYQPQPHAPHLPGIVNHASSCYLCYSSTLWMFRSFDPVNPAKVMSRWEFSNSHMFILSQDSPLCIVTPDFSDNECYKVPPLEDDPFENIGFITAFNTWSLESAPLFTTINNSFSGQLAELERMLPECNNSQVQVIFDFLN